MTSASGTTPTDTFYVTHTGSRAELTATTSDTPRWWLASRSAPAASVTHPWPQGSTIWRHPISSTVEAPPPESGMGLAHEESDGLAGLPQLDETETLDGVLSQAHETFAAAGRRHLGRTGRGNEADEVGVGVQVEDDAEVLLRPGAQAQPWGGQWDDVGDVCPERGTAPPRGVLAPRPGHARASTCPGPGTTYDGEADLSRLSPPARFPRTGRPGSTRDPPVHTWSVRPRP